MKEKSGKSSVLRKISKTQYAIIGMIILGIGIVHFVLQISFIQFENLQSAVSAVANKAENKVEFAPPVKQIITIEPEQVEVKKIKIITLPEIVKVAPRRLKESVSAPKPVKKKEVKEVRETRAQRLRRAEKILTGV